VKDDSSTSISEGKSPDSISKSPTKVTEEIKEDLL